MRKILERRKLPLKFRCLVHSISPLDSAQLTHRELVKYIYETPIASNYFPSQANYSAIASFWNAFIGSSAYTKTSLWQRGTGSRQDYAFYHSPSFLFLAPNCLSLTFLFLFKPTLLPPFHGSRHKEA